MTVAYVYGLCSLNDVLMNMSQKQHRRVRSSRRIISVFLLGLFLSLLAVTQIEPLHRLLHHNAGKPNHHCAVTHFRSGHLLDTPHCDVPIVRAEVVPTTLVVVEYFFIPSVDFSLPPSCGPPALLS